MESFKMSFGNFVFDCIFVRVKWLYKLKVKVNVSGLKT